MSNNAYDEVHIKSEVDVVDFPIKSAKLPDLKVKVKQELNITIKSELQIKSEDFSEYQADLETIIIDDDDDDEEVEDGSGRIVTKLTSSDKFSPNELNTKTFQCRECKTYVRGVNEFMAHLRKHGKKMKLYWPSEVYKNAMKPGGKQAANINRVLRILKPKPHSVRQPEIGSSSAQAGTVGTLLLPNKEPIFGSLSDSCNLAPSVDSNSHVEPNRSFGVSQNLNPVLNFNAIANMPGSSLYPVSNQVLNFNPVAGSNLNSALNFGSIMVGTPNSTTNSALSLNPGFNPNPTLNLNIFVNGSNTNLVSNQSLNPTTATMNPPLSLVPIAKSNPQICANNPSRGFNINLDPTSNTNPYLNLNIMSNQASLNQQVSTNPAMSFNLNLNAASNFNPGLNLNSISAATLNQPQNFGLAPFATANPTSLGLLASPNSYPNFSMSQNPSSDRYVVMVDPQASNTNYVLTQQVPSWQP